MNAALACERSSREWRYIEILIAAFVFSPFLHRLVEWKGNFDKLNLLVILPLIMLLPVAVFIYQRRGKFRNRKFGWVAAIYIAGFVYSGFIGTAAGGLLPALFAGARFCLPALVGTWLLCQDEAIETAYSRVARWLFVLGTIAGGYGIVQYILAPPWDTLWLQSIDVPGDFGEPVRFGIRLFGVLNDPGAFGMFLVVVIIVNIPYISPRNPLHMVGLPFMTVSIMLCLYRTSWLCLLIGVLICVMLGPKPLQNVVRVAVVTGVLLGVVFAGLLAFPDATVTQKITDRFSTLGSVQDDYSFRERQEKRDASIQAALDRPFGVGLGLTGDSAKLAPNSTSLFSNNGTGGSLDNGFVSRLVEMGIPGFLTFLTALLMSIGLAVSRYRRFAASRHRPGMRLIASCIAVQVLIFISNYSEDDLSGLLGVLFFFTVALPLLQSVAPIADAPERRLRSGFTPRGRYAHD